jgi:1,4-alpha-glucan branching enzyme
MPGDTWQKFANLRLLFTYMFGHPGKKLLFMGAEFGQWAEWNYANSLDWHLLEQPDGEGRLHRGLQSFLRRLNELYRESAALHDVDFDWSGFEWIDFSDSDNSVISFRRRARDGSYLIVVCNFTPVVRYNYRLGFPESGTYREALSSDASEFGGSNVRNDEPVRAEDVPWHGQPFSAAVVLPPLAAFVLEPDRRSATRP